MMESNSLSSLGVNFLTLWCKLDYFMRIFVAYKFKKVNLLLKSFKRLTHCLNNKQQEIVVPVTNAK